MFPVEEGDAEVEVTTGAGAGVPQHQQYPERSLAAGEGEGPFVVTESKVFRGRVSVRVAKDWSGHDKGVDTGIVAVVKARKAIQKSHFSRGKLRIK